MRGEVQGGCVTVQTKNMKPGRYSFCKGGLDEGKTEFVAKVGDEVGPDCGIPLRIRLIGDNSTSR